MINQTEIRQKFEQDGYVLVRGLLNPDQDLQPILDDYTDLLDRLAEKWFAEGKIPSTYADLPFDTRFMQIVERLGGHWTQYFDISLPSNPTEETPLHLSQPVFDLMRHRAILDVVEALIGPEIYSNPIQHVRIKPPQTMLIEAEKGNAMVGKTAWHQDQGAALPEADETEIITVWLPITEALEENSCLRVIPGHHRESLLTHCPVLTIPEPLLQREEVTLPMRPGDVLFMHRLTPHASTANVSDTIRWSFDLRYHPVGQPTGRPALPGFIARSEENPDQALSDHAAWVERWEIARQRLIQNGAFKMHRWSGDEAICA